MRLPAAAMETWKKRSDQFSALSLNHIYCPAVTSWKVTADDYRGAVDCICEGGELLRALNCPFQGKALSALCKKHDRRSGEVKHIRSEVLGHLHDLSPLAVATKLVSSGRYPGFQGTS
jgi:hypothetical protein